MTKDDNSREAKVKSIFANYPKEDKIYMASDNRAFFNEAQADGYAQTLKDKKLEVFERVTSDGVEKLMAGAGETEVTGEKKEPDTPEVPEPDGSASSPTEDKKDPEPEEVKEEAAKEEQPAKKSSTKKK